MPFLQVRTTKKYQALMMTHRATKRKGAGLLVGKDGQLVYETVVDQFGRVVRKSKRNPRDSDSDSDEWSDDDY